ncbi:hypothetical protein PAHAL_7G243300 [Panicum hallii]|uniref:Uncharacterized protein n=1 Tax=Panicum hallii TaxID=206008 RepID=A0A2S3I939_9POAL|nr:hypothetical protein PAHAL_7G243300 [Panicum hallii]
MYTTTIASVVSIEYSKVRRKGKASGNYSAHRSGSCIPTPSPPSYSSPAIAAGHTGGHHSPSLRSRRRSGRSNSALSWHCPPSPPCAVVVSGQQAASGDASAAGEDGSSADEDGDGDGGASHCTSAAAAAWAAAAWMSAGDVDAGRGSSWARSGKLRCAARPLIASAATSCARAAISAVGKVPSQMRDFLRGSRISDTHLPQLRRRTPRYDGCLYPLRLPDPAPPAPAAAWALLPPLATALSSVLQQLLLSSPWWPVLPLASTSWESGEQARFRLFVVLELLGTSCGAALMRQEEEDVDDEEEEEDVVAAWVAFAFASMSRWAVASMACS